MSARLPQCFYDPSLLNVRAKRRYLEVIAPKSSPLSFVGPRRFTIARHVFETLVQSGARFTVLREFDFLPR